MWIKTLNRGYLNSDHIVSIRVRQKDRNVEEDYTYNFYQVVASMEGDFYSLTQGVSEYRANELLCQIIAEITQIGAAGTFQTPYDPPTE